MLRHHHMWVSEEVVKHDKDRFDQIASKKYHLNDNNTNGAIFNDTKSQVVICGNQQDEQSNLSSSTSDPAESLLISHHFYMSKPFFVYRPKNIAAHAPILIRQPCTLHDGPRLTYWAFVSCIEKFYLLGKTGQLSEKHLVSMIRAFDRYVPEVCDELCAEKHRDWILLREDLDYNGSMDDHLMEYV
jgi:hypothetical protein